MRDFKYLSTFPSSVEREEIEYLYALKRFGMKMDLEIMKNFVELIGNPHKDLKSVHVAGTNGKGSVSKLVYEILSEKYRVGLYTSPHLVRFTERIVVDGKEIDENYIVDFVNKYRPVIEKLSENSRNPTFFEVTTAIALKYFKDMNVDISVIEVGLGGRLDATNIIMPEISAITTIDKEHTNVLGKTIEKIAREKGGIIKPNIPVVVGEHKKAARVVLKRIAEKNNSVYHNVNDECMYGELNLSLKGMEFNLETPVRTYKIRTRMIGRHQVRNIMVAVRIAEILSENYNISKSDILDGIERAKWNGRFEVKKENPLLIFDAAHNPAGARVLTKTLRDLHISNFTLLFSMLQDKEIDNFLRHFRGLAKRIIVSEINYYRRTPLSELEKYARKYFKDVIAVKNPCEAINIALRDDATLATGSIYFLGELERCLQP